MAKWRETPTGDGNGKQERERGANTSKVRRARRRWWHGGSKWGEVKHREEGGGDRGSTAARPTLTTNWGKKNKTRTRNWGGPQVRDPVPIVSVNPEADPPQPSAPVRPNRAEQDVSKTERQRQPPGCKLGELGSGIHQLKRHARSAVAWKKTNKAPGKRQTKQMRELANARGKTEPQTHER